MHCRVRRSAPFSTCRGRGTWLFRSSPADRVDESRGARSTDDTPDRGWTGSPDHRWQAGALLAEMEAEWGPIPVMGIRVATPSDVAWAEAVLGWGADHGRRVLVRTSLRLPRSAVQMAVESGATVLLEIAHGRPDVQRALLGSHAAGAAGLLLWAQYLRSKRVSVAVHLGPLFPGIHDRGAVVTALARHLAAADIRHVHLSVGRLGPGRLEGLQQVLGEDVGESLRRAFRIHGSRGKAPPWRLSAAAEANLFHGVRRYVEAEGLLVDGCGCLAQCHLDPGRPSRYVPVAAPELFGSAS